MRTQANRTQVVYYTQEELAQREKRRKFLLDYHSRMSMIQDFGACIYIEMVQQYWLEASKKIKKSDVYCRKIKAWTNSADKAMSILMRYVQRADEAWLKAVCKPFPFYAKDFIADGYSFANRLQYNHHQMTKDEKRKLEFTIKNALLAVNCEYTDIVTDVYMAFLFTQTLTFMQDDIWDCLKREAAKDEHPVVKFQKHVIVELNTMLGATANIVAMLKGQDLREKDEISVLNGSKIINRAYWHKDTIKTCLRYETSMCSDYAWYVEAKWLIRERQKNIPLALLDELSEHFSVDEVSEMQRELRKMRVGLGEDDPVELAEVIYKAKNTPMLDELRLFVLTGVRESKIENRELEIED
jgi:hypothetical protein